MSAPICHRTIGPDYFAVGINNCGDTTGWPESPIPRACLGSACMQWIGSHRTPELGWCSEASTATERGVRTMFIDPAKEQK